jgi:hypothetical protein
MTHTSQRTRSRALTLTAMIHGSAFPLPRARRSLLAEIFSILSKGRYRLEASRLRDGHRVLVGPL